MRILEFLKTCALGGLFVLLPLLLLWVLLDEALGLVVALATPIADLFPSSWFENLEAPSAVAFLLILAASFVFGLALQSQRLTNLGSRLEEWTLGRLPMYDALKSLAKGFDSSELGFRTGLLSWPNGSQELVYVVEQHDDGRMTVLIPSAPAAFAGRLRIVPGDRVEILAASLGDSSRVVSLWGVGMGDLLEGTRPPMADTEPEAN
jgi:uncharacterized membrane protein